MGWGVGAYRFKRLGVLGWIGVLGLWGSGLSGFGYWDGLGCLGLGFRGLGYIGMGCGVGGRKA